MAIIVYALTVIQCLANLIFPKSPNLNIVVGKFPIQILSLRSKPPTNSERQKKNMMVTNHLHLDKY